MKFTSTRGQAEPVGFVDACLSGLAPDGGLYVPESWPSIERASADESYVSVACRVIAAFAGDEDRIEIVVMCHAGPTARAAACFPCAADMAESIG